MRANLLRRRYWMAVAALVAFIVLGAGATLWQERRTSVAESTGRVAAIQTQARSAVEARLKATAGMLSDSLINPVYFYDLQAVEQLLSSARNQPDIGYAVVLDRHGRVLHDGTPDIARFSELPGDDFASAGVCHAHADSADIQALDGGELSVDAGRGSPRRAAPGAGPRPGRQSLDCDATTQ
jgi:hypothetical protein